MHGLDVRRETPQHTHKPVHLHARTHTQHTKRLLFLKAISISALFDLSIPYQKRLK
jgi:hypothetical protein